MGRRAEPGRGLLRRRRGLLVLVLAVAVAGCPADDARPDPMVDAEDEAGDLDGDLVIATDVGVTDEACPEAVNEDNGCIYLGIISDLTAGPFASVAAPLTEAQAAFWQRVNADGGIGGFDVDATTYVRDSEYDTDLHEQAFEEIRAEVLGFAQSFGSPQTAAILDDLRGDGIVAAPASWTSAWEFEDVIVESGASYCFEAMNAIDYAFEALDGVESVMAIHYPGEYGDDAAYGVEQAAQANGARFLDVETSPGGDNQVPAIDAVVAEAPDVVFVATGALEMATIVGQAAARGYQGRFIGSGPTWSPMLLDSPAADVLEAMYWQAGPWGPWGTDTPGHEAMREALGDVTPNDGYVAGWTWQYPIKAAIEAAVDRGDLTRAGLRAALEDLTEVDYEGILPAASGNFAPGEPDETAFRESLVSEVDPEAPTGVSVLRDFFVGPTAEGYELTGPCFEQL